MTLIRSIAIGLIVFAAMVVPAAAQIPGSSLPVGESLPITWTIAAEPSPAPPSWAAEVAYHVATIGPEDFTFWYRIRHLGPAPEQRTAHNLKSTTIDVAPDFIQQSGTFWLFGQYEQLDPGETLSWQAENVIWEPNGYKDSAIRWSHGNGLYSALEPGDTIYLWIKATMNNDQSYLTLQNGFAAQTVVPVPHTPEPGAWLVMGSGLAGMIAMVRRRRG